MAVTVSDTKMMQAQSAPDLRTVTLQWWRHPLWLTPANVYSQVCIYPNLTHERLIKTEIASSGGINYNGRIGVFFKRKEHLGWILKGNWNSVAKKVIKAPSYRTQHKQRHGGRKQRCLRTGEMRVLSNGSQDEREEKVLARDLEG